MREIALCKTEVYTASCRERFFTHCSGLRRDLHFRRIPLSENTMPPAPRALSLFLPATLAFGFSMLAHGQTTISSDDFTDGTFQLSSGLKSAWFKSVVTPSTETLSVVADTGSPGLNTGNALDWTTNTDFTALVGVFDTDTTGGFDALSLAVGDKATLSFRFRQTTTLGAAGFLRFGLLNNNGTQVVDVATASNANDDIGYGFALAIGGTSSNFLEDTSTTPPLGGSGISTFGTATFGIANDLASHSAVFTIERLSASIKLTAQIDGGTVFTGTDSTPTATIFHEIAFDSANGNPDIRIDDVVVQVVPEPSSLWLAGSGVLLGLGLRRRVKTAAC